MFVLDDNQRMKTIQINSSSDNRTTVFVCVPLLFFCLFGFHLIFHKVTTSEINCQWIHYRIYEDSGYELFQTNTRKWKDLNDYHQVMNSVLNNMCTLNPLNT